MFTMAIIVIVASNEAIFIYDVASKQRNDVFTQFREALKAVCFSWYPHYFGLARAGKRRRRWASES